MKLYHHKSRGEILIRKQHILSAITYFCAVTLIVSIGLTLSSGSKAAWLYIDALIYEDHAQGKSGESALRCKQIAQEEKGRSSQLFAMSLSGTMIAGLSSFGLFQARRQRRNYR